jgi:hypothetical protein
MDKSEHRKKESEPGLLTFEPQERQIKTRKESQPATDHSPTAKEGRVRTRNESERATGHSPPVECGRTDKSGHGKTRARSTHVLSSIKAGTNQGKKINREREGDSRTVERRARDDSGQVRKRTKEACSHSIERKERVKLWQRKKASKRGALTYYRAQRNKFEQGNKARKRGALTDCRARKGEGASQDMERVRAGEGHLPTIECRERIYDTERK